MLGPENPNAEPRLATQNILTGHVEQQAISEMDFRTQYRTFQTYGYARDPSISDANVAGQVGAGMHGTGYVGNLENAAHLGGATVFDRAPKELRRNKDLRKKREAKGDLSVVDGENAYKGPWAGYEDDSTQQLKNAPEEEEKEETNKPAVETEEKKTAAAKSMPQTTETTIFHGESEYDYLGRTYMAVPQDVDVNLLGEPGTQECFIPKRCIHTWEGHKKGVSAIRFLPKSAHILLSAGMDNKLKVMNNPGNRGKHILTIYLHLDLGCLPRSKLTENHDWPHQSGARYCIQQ